MPSESSNSKIQNNESHKLSNANKNNSNHNQNNTYNNNNTYNLYSNSITLNIINKFLFFGILINTCSMVATNPEKRIKFFYSGWDISELSFLCLLLINNVILLIKNKKFNFFCAFNLIFPILLIILKLIIAKSTEKVLEMNDKRKLHEIEDILIGSRFL